MAKIGSFDYPELKVGDVITIADTLVNEFNGKVNDINAFADRIGHKSANSGSFLVKVGDFRKFGLMHQREYKATRRAEIIANPKNDSEKIDAIKDMIFSIPLFETLNKRLRTKAPTIEQFKTQLIEITGDRTKASKEAEKIRKIYIDAISHIKEDKPAYGGTKEFTDDEFKMEKSNDNQTSEERLLFKSGDVNLSLPKDDAHIEILISVLEKMKNKKK